MFRFPFSLLPAVTQPLCLVPPKGRQVRSPYYLLSHTNIHAPYYLLSHTNIHAPYYLLSHTNIHAPPPHKCGLLERIRLSKRMRTVNQV